MSSLNMAIKLYFRKSGLANNLLAHKNDPSCLKFSKQSIRDPIYQHFRLYTIVNSAIEVTAYENQRTHAITMYQNSDL